MFITSPKISQTINKINKMGAQSIPFLFIIDFTMESPIVYAANEIPQNVFFKTGLYKNYRELQQTNNKLDFTSLPPKLSEYRVAFEKVMDNIKHGNTYLLNLTFPSEIVTNLNLAEIFYLSKARFKLLYRNDFVVFSPETFIEIQGNKISTYPMKGTIDADFPGAEEKLLSNGKELAEHNTVVDLLRNDLSIVSENVRVEKFRYFEKIKTSHGNILQSSSKISGNLPSNYKKKLGNIIFSLLPAGSISGAPKLKTLEIILETETYNRGYYTGVFGYFDGINLDSCVMIRFIENRNEKLIFKSGGGITMMSDLDSEYRELIKKIYVPVT